MRQPFFDIGPKGRRTRPYNDCRFLAMASHGTSEPHVTKLDQLLLRNLYKIGNKKNGGKNEDKTT